MNTQRRNLCILTFVLFAVMLGYGVVIPILPFYIESMGAGGIELGLLAASYAVMRLVFGPIRGGLSDRVGRKPILLVGISGYVITVVLGLVSALAQGLLAGLLTKRCGDERVIKIGLLAAALGFGLMLLANSFVTVILTTASLALAVSIQSPVYLRSPRVAPRLRKGLP